jgi:transforming growth factor-beta-induced protein
MRNFLSGLALLTLSTTHAYGTNPCPVQKDIIEVAREAGSFQTLLTALDVAELTETVRSAPALTVLAPTDAAFAALPEGVLAALLEDKEALRNVLLYHVIGAEVKSDVVVTLTEATMLNGETVDISFDGAELFINSSKVIAADVDASNGVIHVIDAVLVP